jgi:hypothetical protein
MCYKVKALPKQAVLAPCMQAHNVTLRVELPPMDGAGGPCSLVVIRLDMLTYAGMGRRPAAAACFGATHNNAR